MILYRNTPKRDPEKPELTSTDKDLPMTSAQSLVGIINLKSLKKIFNRTREATPKIQLMADNVEKEVNLNAERLKAEVQDPLVKPSIHPPYNMKAKK